MEKTNSPIDTLPEEFASEDEAAEFWDTHSITDYESFIEPTNIELKLTRRHYEIEVDEESFPALRDSAKRQNKPMKHLASDILKEKLAVI